MRITPIYDLTATDKAAVTGLYAPALTGLVLMAGVGFDYGRLAAMDSNLQSGADQGATQLNGASGAFLPASAASIGIATNNTSVPHNDNYVSIAFDPACDAIGSIRFWQNKNRTKQYGY